MTTHQQILCDSARHTLKTFERTDADVLTIARQMQQSAGLVLAELEEPEFDASGLTPREADVLRTILRYMKAHDGMSPTMEELASGLDVTKVTIFEHVGGLERKGRISRVKHAARSISIRQKRKRPSHASA